MNLFESKKDGLYTIIVGCGRLGAHLANRLSESGENVLILDKDQDSFRKLSPSFGGLTLLGDGMDLEILKTAEIEKADVFVVVTDNDNVNIMIAQMGKKLYGIQKIIARLYDPERKCVYEDLDIQTISPAILSALEIEKHFKNDIKEQKG